MREMEKYMEKQEIVGYEPFINELKELIQKKQYRVLQTVNAETINLYWEIGEEIYKQERKWMGKIHCTGIIKGITEGISRSQRLFGRQSLENA